MHSTLNYTRGTWTYRVPLHAQLTGREGAYRFEVLTDSNGGFKPYVCDIRSLDANGQDNSEANAKLLAAAPRMFEQLHSVHEWCYPAREEMPTDLKARCEWYERRLSLIANAAKSGILAADPEATS